MPGEPSEYVRVPRTVPVAAAGGCAKPLPFGSVGSCDPVLLVQHAAAPAKIAARESAPIARSGPGTLGVDEAAQNGQVDAAASM
jgi:hypothetical protein